ncbi:MAG: succinylglutamate desuccinylase/aspartoacylase family protein [Pseudomonadota bacterium]|nr:succinylglutamate desuccinylase/aspartoacylase family protein [Pseudomonadota bacterium]
MSEDAPTTLQRPSASIPPIEVDFPDLASYAAGNDGTPYTWTFGSSEPGPHVAIQALTHGNEVCGAVAVDWLLRERIRPARGTLTLVFANVAAYLRFDRGDPFASRCVDEDFNRLWTAEVLDGPRQSAELTRARELRPIIDRADHLLDLHSMSEPCLPLAMAGRQRKGVDLARAVGIPQHIVIDSGHVAGRRLRDYAFFDDPADPRSALLVECGQHWEAAAPLVARQSALRFLDHFGMLERGVADRHVERGTLPAQRVVEVTSTVTIGSDAFRFTQPVRGLQVIHRAGSVYAVDAGTQISTPHDDCVLIMPTRKPKRGETAVRLGRFVS